MKSNFLQSGSPDFNFTGGEQPIVNTTHVTLVFEPANDAFYGIRESGEWLFDMVSNLFSQIYAILF
ncbi:MAG: hypothetical protein ACE5DL_05335 [Nitrosopumilaceae archaeon]